MAAPNSHLNPQSHPYQAAEALMAIQALNQPVHRLQNGLMSVSRTPAHLVPVAHHNSRSRLLSLPAEIRAQIWEYVVGGNRILVTARMGTFTRDEDATDDLDSSRFDAGRHLALLRVSRQIYSEAATLMFQSNVFSFFGFEGLEALARRVLPGQRDAVRRIVVTADLVAWYEHHRSPWSDPCDAFPNLRVVVVYLSQASRESGWGVIEEDYRERGLRVVSRTA